MSAFMQSDRHISYVIEAAHWPFGYDSQRYTFDGELRYICGREEEVGQILKDQNVRSVDYRYRNNPDAGAGGELPPFVRHTRSSLERTENFDTVALLLAIDGYIHQAEETPDWKETEAFAICNALRERMIRRLPGYSGGRTWSI